MAEQQAPPEAEPTEAVADDEPEAEAIDVSEAAAEADGAAADPAAEEDAADEEPTAEADVDAAADSDDGDDQPAREPDDQAAVDDVTAHTTRVVDPDAEGPATSGMRTPPGIPAGLDPGTLADRDPGPQNV